MEEASRVWSRKPLEAGKSLGEGSEANPKREANGSTPLAPTTYKASARPPPMVLRCNKQLC
ncbi:MAG: hypothetical protein QW291_00790 [Thermofilaceae archaeon]